MSMSPNTAPSNGGGNKMKEAENIEHLSVIDGMARETRGVCGLAAVVQGFVFVPWILWHPGGPETDPPQGRFQWICGVGM